MPVDRGLDRFLGSHDRVHVAIGHEPQFVDDVQIQRVAHRHSQPLIDHGDRDHDVFAGDRFGDQGNHALGDLHRPQVDEFVAELRGL